MFRRRQYRNDFLTLNEKGEPHSFYSRFSHNEIVRTVEYEVVTCAVDYDKNGREVGVEVVFGPPCEIRN